MSVCCLAGDSQNRNDQYGYKEVQECFVHVISFVLNDRLKTNKTDKCGRFRHWLTTALSKNRNGDQTGLWIIASAVKA